MLQEGFAGKLLQSQNLGASISLTASILLSVALPRPVPQPTQSSPSGDPSLTQNPSQDPWKTKEGAIDMSEPTFTWEVEDVGGEDPVSAQVCGT